MQKRKREAAAECRELFLGECVCARSHFPFRFTNNAPKTLHMSRARSLSLGTTERAAESSVRKEHPSLSHGVAMETVDDPHSAKGNNARGPISKGG